MTAENLDRLQTRRLIAERLEPRHFLALLRMHQDPKTMVTLGGVRGPEETRLYLRKNLDHWRRHGHGIWVVVERSTGRSIGRGGLRYGEIEGEARVALSYAISSDSWGQGVGTELARMLVRLALRQLGLSEVIAVAYPHNMASRRVMEKAGLRFEREVMHGGEAHVLYSLKAPIPVLEHGT